MQRLINSSKYQSTIIVLICCTVISGCRAIGRIGESSQTVAARRLSGQGHQAMHEGRWNAAETFFNDALEVSADDDRAHWGLAEAYWNRNEQDLALEHMEQAVQLSGGDPKLVQRLGRMYLEMGRLDEADQQSLRALEMQRDNEDVWALRGDCLRATGKLEDALAAYHRALALRPDYPEVQLSAAEIYSSSGRFDRVLATLDRLQDGVGVDDAPPRVDMLQGVAMRQLGRHQEARRCLVRAAGKDPSDATIHLELASLDLHLGQFDRARQSLNVARTLDPDSVREGQWLAELQRQEQELLGPLNSGTLR